MSEPARAGDPRGDLSFFLSRHNLRAECALDPTAHGHGCFLAGQNVIVQYDVEVDGRCGPPRGAPTLPRGPAHLSDAWGTPMRRC